MTVTAVKLLIVLYACIYNVSPTLALRICELESDFNVTAIGDQGAARGLYQIHNNGHDGSWQIMRRAMGETTEDLRLDARENIKTALFAMGELGLYRWWSTYDLAQRNITPPRESITGARLRRIKKRYSNERGEK